MHPARSPSPGRGNDDDPQRAYLYPRPRDSGLQLLGFRSLSPVPWDPRVPPSCISWSPSPGPSPLSPQGPHLELNKCAIGSPPCSVCVLSSVGTRGLGGRLRRLSCPLLLLPQGLRLSPHPSFHTSPRGLPFSAPLSPSASLRPSGGGHRPQSPTVLPFPSSHPCLWGLETREEMTEPLWSPPACVLPPGHTLRPEAAPTRYSDTSVWRPWART